MPELPEIASRSREIDGALVGRKVAAVDVLQPKILNVPVDAFQERLAGRSFRGAECRGKWICCRLTGGWLLVNLGMGGEILLHAPGEPLPEKLQAVLTLDDGQRLSLHFWWFGYLHYVDTLADHGMVGQLGPNADGLSLDEFRALLAGRRGAIKSFLLDQSRVAGIGNVYIQDPLFKAGIHPLRPIQTLTDEEVAALWTALRDTLRESIEAGGAHFEKTLYGQPGGWSATFLVGYREGQPCPACGTAVEKIKTGSTSGFICPRCQPL